MANLDPAPMSVPVDIQGGALSSSWKRWFDALQRKLYPTFVNYGEFLCTSSQSTSANTATKLTLDTAVIASGVSLSSNHITFNQAGYYNLELTALVKSTAAGVQQVFLWMRKNGADVDNSGVAQSVSPSGSGYTLVSTSTLLQFAQNDYIEVWWATDSTSVTLAEVAAISSPFVMPAIPAVQLAVTLVTTV